MDSSDVDIGCGVKHLRSKDLVLSPLLRDAKVDLELLNLAVELLLEV